MVLSEKTLYSLGRRCVYIFNRRKAKKEIPVQLCGARVAFFAYDCWYYSCSGQTVEVTVSCCTCI